MSVQSAWSNDEESLVTARYNERFSQFGYGEKALGWGDKGRQRLRFETLASNWPLKDMRVLDLGAGFGDFFDFVAQAGIKNYVGMDVTEVLISEGRRRFGRDSRFNLKLASATDRSAYEQCDIVVISGLFNFRLSSGKNLDFITEVLSLAYEFCSVGVSCNFVTNRVDYHDSLIHYQSPEEALSIGLSLSKNCVIKQNYMPFEFSLFIDHRDLFNPDIAVFDHIVSG